jgi:tellurite resistance protein TerC
MMPYILFGVFILTLLIIDLKLINKSDHVVSFKEAVAWSVVWITLALLFNLLIYFWKGPDAAVTFLSAYLIEKSLSVDNLFVFLLVFKYFQVRQERLHRVLFWGILGALVMRGIFIAAGIALITRFHFTLYIFGAFLIYTGIKMFFEKDKEIHPDANPVLRLFRRVFPVSDEDEGGKFFVRKENRWMATPLFLVLLFIEATDVVFAVDSIPAIFSITLDPFIVYTSNIFAILGLRALFFAVSSIMDRFHHLHYGLSAILVFVGIKMIVSHVFPIPVTAALGVLLFFLVGSIITSRLFPKAS